MIQVEEIATTFGGDVFRGLRVVEHVAGGLMQYVKVAGEREQDPHVYHENAREHMAQAAHACLLQLIAKARARRAFADAKGST